MLLLPQLGGSMSSKTRLLRPACRLTPHRRRRPRLDMPLSRGHLLGRPRRRSQAHSKPERYQERAEPSPPRFHRAVGLTSIYAPRTQKIVKSISRFKDVARSGNIRHDGKLVAAGDDTGLIQVRQCSYLFLATILMLIPCNKIFDINSRAILRTMDEHKQ